MNNNLNVIFRDHCVELDNKICFNVKNKSNLYAAVTLIIPASLCELQTALQSITWHSDITPEPLQGCLLLFFRIFLSFTYYILNYFI